MPPKPCRHCGINFMPADLSPHSKNLCNNCMLRESKQKTKETIMKDEVSILINFPRKYHVAIEEKCMNEGINFSHYFLRLYERCVLEGILKKNRDICDADDLPEAFGKLNAPESDIENFGEKFEKIAQNSKKQKGKK